MQYCLKLYLEDDEARPFKFIDIEAESDEAALATVGAKIAEFVPSGYAGPLLWHFGPVRDPACQ